jgi:hypothetical protein
MKTVDQLADEFTACYPEVGTRNATLRGCIWDAWQFGKMEGLKVAAKYFNHSGPLFTERDEVEAGIEFLNEREMQ